MDPIVPSYAAALIVFISSLIIYWFVQWQASSPVRVVVGPPCSSWIFGHTRELLLSPQYGDQEFEWQKLYGPVYRVKGCFGGAIFEGTVNLLFGGKSVIAARGDEHRRLRHCVQAGSRTAQF
ncbi:hypothetical protein B0H14DRAFT_2756835 [Mycena olivaceomarginata]|nr:hypothetical protein B0H14DRAFT_2756835 [Mycena olivaceomarginata]